jgi:hypothetical protein
MTTEDIFQQYADKAQVRKSELFDGFESVGKIQDIVNIPFEIIDFGFVPRVIDGKDWDYVHILMKINDKTMYLSTKAYRIVDALQEIRKDKNDQQVIGKKAMIYSKGNSEGYMIKLV